jgi:hypothetical protein
MLRVFQGDMTMNAEQTSAHSHTTADGRDEPYTWGRAPSTYLAPREIVRATILRSRLLERDDVRARVRGIRQ